MTTFSAKRKIVLIGIDGLMLDRAIASGRASTLNKLRDEGFFVNNEVDMPTVSGPSWSTYLTGVRQDQHKVTDNFFVDHNLSATPDLLTQALNLNSELITYASAGWPPLIAEDDVGPVIAPGKHLRFSRDGETHGYTKIDKEIADHAVQTIREIAPDFSFVYFCGADEAGHRHGTLFGPYFDAIERIDNYLSEIHQVLLERKEIHGEEWLLVIITDHGHRDEGGHGGDSAQERASFVIANGIGRDHPNWPLDLPPHDLTKLLLAEL